LFHFPISPFPRISVEVGSPIPPPSSGDDAMDERKRKEVFHLNDFFKVSLQIGRVVKFKKLFDFFSAGFYNLKKRADSISKKEVRER
jgi:hypothetical protein